MTATAALIERDLSHLWHPCTPLKDHQKDALLAVERARGCWIRLTDGREIFDAIASWWCKSLGHGHPRLRAALMAQAERFEHVILAGTTNEVIVTLTEQLAQLAQGLTKVFYAGDGSSAVEVALKMSLHVRQRLGQRERAHFLCLANGYHGETVGTLSVSDVGRFREPYTAMLFQSTVLQGVPYVTGASDPRWHDASDAFNAVLPQLLALAPTLTAIIFEPIVQGAGGMKIISADFLHRLGLFAKAHGIHVIADEIMTGFGRTGKTLACEHAKLNPDFVCLSKGMTSGWLPMSAVLTTEAIYEVFRGDQADASAFLHSHTYSGNALAAAVASEALTVMAELKVNERAEAMGKQMRAALQGLADEMPYLTNVRGIGAMVAADIDATHYRASTSKEIRQHAPNHGVLLRPLGNTVYWTPPLIASPEEIQHLANATRDTLNQVISHG